MTNYPFKCIVYQTSYKNDAYLLWCEENLKSKDYMVNITVPFMTKQNWVILGMVYTFKYEIDLLAFKLVHDVNDMPELYELHK
jgi:hypothetical protein